MDLPRILLIAAIAGLSFMLLTEWVAFKEEMAVPPPTSTQTSGKQPSAQISGGDIAPMPDDQRTASSNDDIPLAPGAATEVIADALPASSAQTIQIRSDVMLLTVDLRGGDITQVALPRYPAKIDNPDNPIQLLQDNDHLLYIAQSGLIGRDGIDSKERAHYQAQASSFTMGPNDDTLSVDLIHEVEGGVTVTKRMTLTRGEYLVDVSYIVENNSTATWQANLFGQIKRDGRPDPSAAQSSGMGMVPFLGFALTKPDERFAKYNFDDVEEEPLKLDITGGWIAMIQHYFLSAWIPNPEQTHSYSTRVSGDSNYIGGFTSPALVVSPGKIGITSARFYAGPKDQYRLREISEYLDLSVDYGWLWWIAQPLFWLLIKIYGLVGNWGTAIILLTVTIKAGFYKLSATSFRSMANMRRVQPQLVELRERHADDKQKQSQAMMELYKKEKINPLSGCLPILVQMPVFIALYWTLMESVELRQAPFYLWIEDLSVMDPYFILPLIMGASMWFQQRLNPPMADPMQAKVMQWMPVIFTFFFLWFPAGLVLYWVANNLLGIAQQWYITRQIENQAAAK
jgi:YidC/Oxa1 family membrane protein insertase